MLALFDAPATIGFVYGAGVVINSGRLIVNIDDQSADKPIEALRSCVPSLVKTDNYLTIQVFCVELMI
jgi:hypothetical protein